MPFAEVQHRPLSLAAPTGAMDVPNPVRSTARSKSTTVAPPKAILVIGFSPEWVGRLGKEAVYTMCEMEVKLVDPQAQGVILDIDGNVAENKGGNIFIVAEGILKTPTANNCLAGISRETVLELAGRIGLLGFTDGSSHHYDFHQPL